MGDGEERGGGGHVGCLSVKCIFINTQVSQSYMSETRIESQPLEFIIFTTGLSLDAL